MSQTQLTSDHAETEGNAAISINDTRRNKRRTKMPGLNYEPAQDFEIWQVARAATAARFYFKPLDIDHDASGYKFSLTDGGFSHINNPTSEGKREIEDLYGDGSIGVVVSVGTARKLKEDRKKKPFFSVIPVFTRETGYKMTNPDIVHRKIKREHEMEKSFSYYRLDNPGGLNTSLDEWRPKNRIYNKDSGSKTVADIKAPFAEWATQLDNIQQLQRCARELVAQRRKRSKTARWERYATGCQFRCRERGCAYGNFFDRSAFEDHLKSLHLYEDRDLDYEVKGCRKQWRYQCRPEDRG